MRKKMRYTLICTAFLVLSSILFLGMGSLFSDEGKEKAAPVQEIVLKDTTGFTTVISEVAELLTPAVVHINITGTVVQRAPQIPFFRDFFDMSQEREMPIRAMGSGLIIDENGHIITNNHIVQRADTIEVELHDGTTHEADTVGTDPSTDLAIIKIDPTEDMKFARFGDSERLRVGEWVVAIGSPRGLTWTVTAGIISAKNRSNIGVLGPSGYEDFLQTDAAGNDTSADHVHGVYDERAVYFSPLVGGEERAEALAHLLQGIRPACKSPETLKPRSPGTYFRVIPT